jgi:hypothetical protein
MEGTQTPAGIWRDGNLLVYWPGAQFPARCLKCNAQAAPKPFKKTLYWHPPWVYLLIFVHLFVYVIVGLITRKSAKFSGGFCPGHLQRRRIGIAIAVFGGLGGFAGMILGAMEDSPALAVLAGLGMIVSIIVGAVMARLLSVQRIEQGYVYLKGVHPAFLHHFPSVGAPRGVGGNVAPDVVQAFD